MTEERKPKVIAVTEVEGKYGIHDWPMKEGGKLTLDREFDDLPENVKEKFLLREATNDEVDIEGLATHQSSLAAKDSLHLVTFDPDEQDDVPENCGIVL